MTSLPELKSCPFCGEQPIYQSWHTSKNAVLIGCDTCDTVQFLGKNKPDAFRRWNTRTPSPHNKEATIEALREALKYQVATQNKQAELLETRNFRGQVNADTVAHNLKLNAAHAAKALSALNKIIEGEK